MTASPNSGTIKATTQESRLSIQSLPIETDTTAIRSLDWERSRFDIEFGLRNGTT